MGATGYFVAVVGIAHFINFSENEARNFVIFTHA